MYPIIHQQIAQAHIADLHRPGPAGRAGPHRPPGPPRANPAAHASRARTPGCGSPPARRAGRPHRLVTRAPPRHHRPSAAQSPASSPPTGQLPPYSHHRRSS